MFRVGATIETDEGEDRIETLLQNAETIRVPTREGRKSVTDLQAGDEELVYYEAKARHYGEAVLTGNPADFERIPEVDVRTYRD